MSFNSFVYEQGIIGVTIGTISGFAISNLMKDINRSVIVKFVKYLRLANVYLISSLIEFALQLLIVYLLYTFMLYPIFKLEIEGEREEEKKRREWRSELLSEVKTLDVGNVYF